MTVTATLTPFDLSEAKPLGKRLFRKQILKKGVIRYKGQKIDFDDAMMAELAQNFDKGAYDQVPLVFANEANQHNEDPERFHGELLSVELTPDGIDGIFSLTPKGAKVVKDNPRLGVSARIMGGVEHADGRTFGRSIRHVLATMNPRLTGMKPWQAAMDLSDDEEIEVVDLTALSYKEGSPMATKSKAKAKGKPANGVVTVTTSKGPRNIDLSALSDEEFQALLDLAVESTDEDDTDLSNDDDLDEDDEEEEEDEDEDLDDEEEDEDDDDTDLANPVPPAFVKNMKGKKGKKSTVAGEETDEASTPGAAKRKGKAKKKEPAFSLSNAVAERLAQGEWRRERREYVKAGVPPHMLDLAAPILSSPDAIMIDLSDDDSVDAAGVIRGLLDSAKGYIEQKPELGHQIDLSEDDEDGKPNPTEAFLTAWETEYGKA